MRADYKTEQLMTVSMCQFVPTFVSDIRTHAQNRFLKGISAHHSWLRPENFAPLLIPSKSPRTAIWAKTFSFGT